MYNTKDGDISQFLIIIASAALRLKTLKFRFENYYESNNGFSEQ